MTIKDFQAFRVGVLDLKVFNDHAILPNDGITRTSDHLKTNQIIMPFYTLLFQRKSNNKSKWKQ